MGTGDGTGVPTTSKELRRSSMNEKQMKMVVAAAVMVGVSALIIAFQFSDLIKAIRDNS